jgi:hypothetical protein
LDFTLIALLAVVVLIFAGMQVLGGKKQSKYIEDHHPQPIPCDVPPVELQNELINALPTMELFGRRWKVGERSLTPCRFQARFLLPNDRGGFDVDIIMNLLCVERTQRSSLIEFSYVVLQSSASQDADICKATNKLIADTAKNCQTKNQSA